MLKMKCDHDCFNCPFSDCILPDDELTEAEVSLSDSLDARITIDNAPVEEVIRWNRRGRPRKTCTVKETEQYREERRAYQREYYRKHKEERLAYQSEYDKSNYQKNREKMIAKRVERHKRRMQDPEYAEKYRAKERERYYRRKAERCLSIKSI